MISLEQIEKGNREVLDQHPRERMLFMSTKQGNMSSIAVAQEFEAWWLRLIQREPHFAEYVKLKRVCSDAFVAGVTLIRGEKQAA